ncbi:MAG: oligoribonuclease [Candidatus Nomurabacteria bacterium]|jgi:oligoribonuclease|nr:oligoribonuclease [Candidatus Nomurabacteria bacterium]
MSGKASLLWIDLEMTGLDPVHDRIMEVAAVATDWNLTEIAHIRAVVRVSTRLAERRMTGEFWERNVAVRTALLEQNQREGRSRRGVEDELLRFITKHFDTKNPIYLAGNSIHQDRKFIEREWSRLDARLHYRMLDVSAWKLVFENKLGVKFKKPEAHRAAHDIAGSIAELKKYLGHVKC